MITFLKRVALNVVGTLVIFPGQPINAESGISEPIITLENEHLRLEFDRDNGNLRQIINRSNHEEFINDPDYSRLVRIIQRTPEKSSNILLSHEAGRPDMALVGDTLQMKFPSLRDEGEETGIFLTVDVRLPKGSEEALFSFEIENLSDFPLVEAWFPYIAGRLGRGGESDDVFTTSRGRQGNIYGRFDRGMFNTHAFGRHLQRIGVSSSGLLPMMDLSTPSGGLSYIKYEKRARPTDFVYINLSEDTETVRLGWAWVTTILLNPGETYRSVEFGVGVHESDWHATADRLRHFLADWWAPSERARLMRSKIGLFHIQIKGFNGEPYHDFDDLPDIARDCERYGIRDLMFWDYTASVYFRPDAAGDYWEMPASRMSKLKQNLREVRDLGFQISACVNYRLVMKTSRAWKRIGSEAQYSFFGQPLYGNPGGSMNGAIYLNKNYEQGIRSLCQGTDRFHEHAMELTNRTLDIGLSSLFIDQSRESIYALPKDRNDLDPHEVMERSYGWHHEAAKLARDRDPNAYCLGQTPDLWNTQSIDALFNWEWESWSLPEVFLYILPEICIVWPTDENQRSRLSKAFSYGALLAIATRDMTGLLSANPEYAEHIARLAELRRKTLEYIAHGRFVDQRGLSVNGGSGNVFLSDRGVGVTLANSSDGTAELEITLDPAMLPSLDFEKGVVYFEVGDPAPARPRLEEGMFLFSASLDPYAAAVLTIPTADGEEGNGSS